ncbi:MAG: hypothetical protein JW850_09810 [Thermoflexales bacterium]|nr:hypothetical protein [Thermoflexales bacterium]
MSPSNTDISSRQRFAATQRSKALEYLNKIQSNSPQPSKRMVEDALLSILSQPEENWKDAAQRHGLAFGPDIYQRLKALRELQYEDLQVDAKERCLDMQSLVDFKIMEETKAAFDHLISEKFERADQYRISDKVFFGTIETVVVNALITRVPDSDEFLIIINRQLWELAKLLSFTLAGILFNKKGELRAFNPRNTEPYASIFVQNVVAILDHSWPTKQIPLLKNTVPELMWVVLDTSLHDFIMGHEYGHFLRSHFTNTGTLGTRRIGGMDISFNNTSWKNEYEADGVGLDLAVFRAREQMVSAGANPANPMAQGAMSYAMTLAYLGCWACLHLMLRMEQIWGIIYDADAKHPPTPLRIAAMLRIIIQQMPNEGSAKYASEQLKNVAQCIGILFQQVMSAGTRKNNSQLNALESAFQNLVFQAILLDRHKDVICDLEAMLPSFRPPYPVHKTMHMIEKRQLVLTAYKMLHDAFWLQTATWQECVSIIEKSILILKNNFSIWGDYSPTWGT